MEETIKIKARITTLGVDAGEQVEIENTEDVRQKLEAGYFVLLQPIEA
jgi:hypothetical protein